jgi:CheY-like chemotaxis protein
LHIGENSGDPRDEIVRLGRFSMEFAILILSDINMPGMSGLELLPKAKAIRPDVPIIMITAYGDAETKRKALENGAEADHAAPSTRMSISLRSITKSIGLVRSANRPPPHSSALLMRQGSGTRCNKAAGMAVRVPRIVRQRAATDRQ